MRYANQGSRPEDGHPCATCPPPGPDDGPSRALAAPRHGGARTAVRHPAPVPRPPGRHALLGADQWLLAGFRRAGARWPGAGRAARGLSLAGEHAALWLAAGTAAAALDPARRQAWLRATAAVCAAHLTSSAVKQTVRRPRPAAGGPRPPVGRHSFPSSHAASSAAAAAAFAAVSPAAGRLARPLAAGVCLARLVAGVHYPTDVAAGALLGAAVARAVRGGVRPDG
ncbi:phosphatase PAP2 family protein [Streptomyces sp. ODS05-4]|uniref:phosphatase PAP2 family protein n=1 Tax=Streptomyces sp. ODS05-4 TaxID=2944939 RepID=UPI0027E3D257|nr:phosphatase PAP2 family protein [Streptomyces sp. ODS05-4]